MGVVKFSKSDNYLRRGYRIGDQIVEIGNAGEPSNDFKEMSNEYEDTVLQSILESDRFETHHMDSTRLHSPTSPEKIICLEGCYEDDLLNDEYDPHLADEDYHQQGWPSVSVAPSSALRGPSKPLRIPSYAEDVRPGVELAFVVSKQAKNLTVSKALDVIFGYTTVTNLRIFDEIPTLEGYKMYDGSFACGPEIVPADQLSFEELILGITVDKVQVTRSTSEWRFSPEKMIAEASRIMTLKPGDLITTGCPTRYRQPVESNTIIKAHVEGVSPLYNSVVRDAEDE